jgi:Fe-S-cluster containining protein
MLLPNPEKLKIFHDRMRAVYEKMDAAYDEVQAHYGLTCEGCDDNCCTQRFFHYTLAEYFYLMEGFKKLDAGLRAEAMMRAKEVADSYEGEVAAGELKPLMCPLNFDGLCSVYAFRPMICRAHGLPHSFTRPDGQSHEGGGCRRFEAEHTADRRIDRTDFYMELAAIERDVRAETGIAGRYMKTTAQMLMDMAGELDTEGDRQ